MLLSPVSSLAPGALFLYNVVQYCATAWKGSLFMLQTVIPQGYAPCLNLYDTQKAIGLLKRLFEDTLGGALHLRRVSAPLFVEASTGLNDDLNLSLIHI